MRRQVLSAREADVVLCLVDTVAAPAAPLPAPARTDAVAAFDSILAAAPALNRAALRILLWALELGPLATGTGERLRRLGPAARRRHLDAAERGGLGPALRALLALVKLAYYGEDGVMATLGFDADAVVERGRALRREESRW